MDMNPTVGKWLAGIAASIIAALIIWFLTHSGGPLNPIPAPVADKPILRIVDVQVTHAPLGGTAHATVKVFNEGKATGEACTVWWYSGSDVGKELASGLNASKAAVSDAFGLPPTPRSRSSWKACRTPSQACSVPTSRLSAPARISLPSNTTKMSRWGHRSG